jgi:hypothetical protein
MSLGSVQIYSGLGNNTVEDFSGAWYTAFVTSLLSDFQKFQADVINNVSYGVDLSNYALTSHVNDEVAGLNTSLTTYVDGAVSDLTAYLDQEIASINASQDLTLLTGRVTALETEIDGGLFS